jgi:hypothetical protein
MSKHKADATAHEPSIKNFLFRKTKFHFRWKIISKKYFGKKMIKNFIFGNPEIPDKTKIPFSVEQKFHLEKLKIYFLEKKKFHFFFLHAHFNGDGVRIARLGNTIAMRDQHHISCDMLFNSKTLVWDICSPLGNWCMTAGTTHK